MLDRDDRDFALPLADLLEVAKTEPHACLLTLCGKPANDRGRSVAARAAKLLHAVDGIGEKERHIYFSSFGM